MTHRLGLLGSGDGREQRRLPFPKAHRLNQKLVADLSQGRRRLDTLMDE